MQFQASDTDPNDRPYRSSARGPSPDWRLAPLWRRGADKTDPGTGGGQTPASFALRPYRDNRHLRGPDGLALLVHLGLVRVSVQHAVEGDLAILRDSLVGDPG